MLSRFIPKIIHQTAEKIDSLSPDYIENIAKIRRINPDWEYYIYSKSDREDFIRSEYGGAVLKNYLKIDSRYGAAQADYFRYLAVFRKGGLYLDIKATSYKSLSSLQLDSDRHIVANWPQEIDGVNLSQIGMHNELPFPEYQNWFILSEAEGEVLNSVIENIGKNISEYTSWKNGVGKMGVLRTTGPIAYSRVIHPFVLDGKVTVSSNEYLGLRPTFKRIVSSSNPFPSTGQVKHYSQLTIPIVRRSRFQSEVVSLSTKIVRKLKRLNKRYVGFSI